MNPLMLVGAGLFAVGAILTKNTKTREPEKNNVDTQAKIVPNVKPDAEPDAPQSGIKTESDSINDGEASEQTSDFNDDSSQRGGFGLIRIYHKTQNHGVLEMIPSKGQMVTIGMTLVALWAVHNVSAFEPVKKFLNFDQQ